MKANSERGKLHPRLNQIKLNQKIKTPKKQTSSLFMVQRRYKVKNHFRKFKKLLKGSALSGKAKKLIEIEGKPTKLPKKIRQGVKESYRRFSKKFKQSP